MKLFISLQVPHNWAILDHRNIVVDQGVVDNLESYRLPGKVEQVVGVAPGQYVITRAVSIPGKRRSNIESALPYALEEHLTEDVHHLHFTLMEWSPGNLAHASIISRDKLKLWIETFRLNGLHLDYVIPEYLLLPLHPKGDTTIGELEDGRIYLREGKYGGLSLDSGVFQYWWESLETRDQPMVVNNRSLAKNLIANGGSAISLWEIGSDFPAWMSGSQFDGDLEKLNLLHGDFSPSHRRPNYAALKTALVIAGISFIVFWASSFVEYKELKAEHRQLKRDIVTLFLQSFPNEPWLDRPRSQVESLINRARSGNSSETDFQLYMNAVSAVTPKYRAVVEEIGFRDNSMEVLCTVNDLSSLDGVRQAFDQLDGISAELVSSGARDNKVTGRFRLSRS